MAGTIRYFKQDICDLAEQRMRELCAGFATAYGVEIKIDVRNTFDVLINDPMLSDAYLEAAEDIVGKENISDSEQPATGSEDFADMLKVVPGAYSVSYTHLRAHETRGNLVCRLLLEKKK